MKLYTHVDLRVMGILHHYMSFIINPLNAELNQTCHMMALLGDYHILHVSRIRANFWCKQADHKMEVAFMKYLTIRLQF